MNVNKKAASRAKSRVEVLDNIVLKPDLSRLLARLRIHGEGHQHEEKVKDLLEAVMPVACPKAIFKESYITRREGDVLEVDKVKFTSPLLRVNLEKAEQVFPYVITCGQELEDIRVITCDESSRYSLDIIKEMVLNETETYLQDYLLKKYNLDIIWSLNPGEMQAWPANNRKLIFSLLGNVKDAIGVKLSEDYSMLPAHSRAGIFYYTDIDFESCQLCSKEPCMGRRAPYSSTLAQKYPHKTTGKCGH